MNYAAYLGLFFLQEFACLQEHYENITIAACKKQVQQLTELESENILDFDDILAKECEPMLKEFCQVKNVLVSNVYELFLEMLGD